MKFNEQQKELVALLPKEVRGDKDLTDSAKLVLGNIILLMGMDFAEDNGYIYRTNDALMDDTGIGSKSTLTAAIRLLVTKGLIVTERGKKREKATTPTASRYRLGDGVLLKCTDKVIDNQQNIEKCTCNCTSNNEKCTCNCTCKIEDKISTMELNIKELVEVIKELKSEIAELKCTVYSTLGAQKCTVDVDVDIDKEIITNNVNDNKGEIVHEWKDDEILDFDEDDEMKFYGFSPIEGDNGDCQGGNAQVTSCNGNVISSGIEVNKANASKYDAVNAKFSNLINTLKSTNTVYSQSTNQYAADGYWHKILQLKEALTAIVDDLTDKQIAFANKLLQRSSSIHEAKTKYFSKLSENPQSTNEVNPQSNIYSDDEWAQAIEQQQNKSQLSTHVSEDFSGGLPVANEAQKAEIEEYILKVVEQNATWPKWLSGGKEPFINDLNAKIEKHWGVRYDNTSDYYFAHCPFYAKMRSTATA